MKQVLFFILYLGLSSSIFAQSLGRQVIASTGSIGTTGVSSSTTGPSNLFTVSNETIVLTQGFQQPVAGGALVVTPLIELPNCADYNGGSIDLSFSGCTGDYSVLWMNGSTEATIEDLLPGTYSVTVTSGDCTYSENFTLTLDNDCTGDLPNVVSVNSDGANDIWIIPQVFLNNNIDNTVSIYNRWGQVVWETTDYNNNSNYWAGENNSDDSLPTGTYFYKIELPNEILSGFIELLR